MRKRRRKKEICDQWGKKTLHDWTSSCTRPPPAFENVFLLVVIKKWSSSPLPTIFFSRISVSPACLRLDRICFKLGHRCGKLEDIILPSAQPLHTVGKKSYTGRKLADRGKNQERNDRRKNLGKNKNEEKKMIEIRRDGMSPGWAARHQFIPVLALREPQHSLFVSNPRFSYSPLDGEC